MDDNTFNDRKSALDWIQLIESDGAKVREADIYPRLGDWVNRLNLRRILDIGSGQGICSEKMNLKGRRYTGLEPSDLLVKRANDLYGGENKKFAIGSVYEMPFSDGAFDAAFSVAVWHLLSDLARASVELSRILEKNGHFLIITANPNAYSLWTNQYSEKKVEGRRFEGTMMSNGEIAVRDVLYLYTLEEILTSLNSAGLKVSKVETFRDSGDQHKFVEIQGQKS